MSLEISFKAIHYADTLPNFETGEETEKTIQFRDLVKLDEPMKGRTFVQYSPFTVRGKRLFAFSAPSDFPSNRYLAVTTFVTLAQTTATSEDFNKAFGQIAEMLQKGDTEGAAAFIAQCQTVINLTDYLSKWLNLSTAFLMFEDENPLYYDSRINKEKLKLLTGLDSVDRKKIAEWTREYFDTLIQKLLKDNPECFLEDTTKAESTFFDTLKVVSERSKQMSIFLNNVAAKSQTDRDRLLMYPVSTLYSDMRHFIIEGEQTVEELEKLRTK